MVRVRVHAPQIIITEESFHHALLREARPEDLLEHVFVSIDSTGADVVLFTRHGRPYAARWAACSVVERTLRSPEWEGCSLRYSRSLP